MSGDSEYTARCVERQFEQAVKWSNNGGHDARVLCTVLICIGRAITMELGGIREELKRRNGDPYRC